MIALLALRSAAGAAFTKLASAPPWIWWTLGALAALGGSYHMGRSHEAKLAAAAMTAYKQEQVAAAVKIVKAEAVVVTKTEIVYRDRVQKIYTQGATIEKLIPQYIEPVDDKLFAVSAGFVRVVDGAWTGHVDGPAKDSDRESAGVPLSEIAAVEAGNATSCRAWRDQAIGWREFYAGQQGAVNGKIGEWYLAEKDPQPMQGSADQQ